MIPMTTGERTFGMKKAVRKTVRPLVFPVHSTTARKRPITTGAMVPMTTQIKLCKRDRHISESCISLR